MIALFIANTANIFAYLTDKDSILNRLSVKAEYTIVFDANTGTGTMQNQEISYNVGTKLSKNLFTKEECVFNGWNTKADGTGTSYADEEVVTNINDTVLYAQWKENEGKYNVIFHKNKDDVVGEMSSQEFNINEEKKLSANQFSLTDYEFVGWNTKEDGTGENYTNEQLVMNLSEGEDVNLYAQWNRIKYTNNNTIVFDGTNYIDTDMRLFSERNKNRDFIAEFTIDAIEDEQEKQAVIFGCIDETGLPYPGTVVRVEEKRVKSVTNVNSQTTSAVLNNTLGTSIIIKRINNVLSYSVDGGQTFIEKGDYSNFSHPFDIPATFGAGLDENLNPFRYFKGTISNLNIEYKEPEYYTIKYNANGGTGTVNNQFVRKDESFQIKSNSFTKDYYVFKEWNTKTNGTGTTYHPGDTETNLTNLGETITLYAQWQKAINYNVVFHSNTETDETTTQEYTYNNQKSLNANTFTKPGYYFAKWNTEPDGSGQFFDDEQIVNNLCENEGDHFDLYAIWTDEVYTYGETVFDGTNYIDTGVYLFNNENANRNFEISFEIKKNETVEALETLVSAMDETASPWPGINYRIRNSGQNTACVNASNSDKHEYHHSSTNITKVSIKRLNNIVYLQLNDGENKRMANMSNLIHTFDVPVTFGCSLTASGAPQKQFTGTLSNMKIMLF